MPRKTGSVLLLRFMMTAATLLSLQTIGLTSALADPVADFYKGRQLHIIVSSDAGGAYDTYARLMAQVYASHIPGNPTIVVQNMPGASGLRTGNHMFKAAARDGTVIAATHSSVPTAPLTSRSAASFEANQFSWIGSITSDPFVGYVWHTTSIQTFDDTLKTETIMGGNAIGAAGVDYAIVARELTGAKLKIVTGYPNSTDVKLAMERGEVHGTFANAYGSLRTAEPTWIKEKKIRIIIQHGLSKHRDLPDVPLMIDYVKDAADRQAVEFMLARQEFSKPYAAPPEVPAERLAILRKAFDATMKDPAFLAEIEKANLAVDSPMAAPELAAMIAKVAKTPASAVKRIEDMFDRFRAAAK